MSRALIEDLKDYVTAAAGNPEFIHSRWYVEHHLRVVERIADELMLNYPHADADMVHCLVWIHDLGKIVDRANEHEATLVEGGRLLRKIGFADDFVEQAIDHAELIDSSLTRNLTEAPIEVRIVSTADGCAHFVGPFMQLWWWENPDKGIDELMAGNLRKAAKDWTRKIVLPEAHAAFADRYRFLQEQNGILPEKFSF